MIKFFIILEALSRNELLQVFKTHSTYIHTSNLKLWVYQYTKLLNRVLKKLCPKIFRLYKSKNKNIFKYEFGNYSSAINACNESIKN
ncbi:hypothetical protein CM15mP35_10030 [bacterium]|nr:MAG: hypothetical protein CM15mP35_10030 [bacterium]